MILDDVMKNAALRRALSLGEEQMGKVVGKLLSSEAVTRGLRGIFSSASKARETFDRGMKQVLEVANLPSREDVLALKRKLSELEATIDVLSARVGPAEKAPEEKPGPEEDVDEAGGEAGADA